MILYIKENIFRMIHGTFRCPSCKNNTIYRDDSAQAISCQKCGFSVKVVDGIPLFYEEKEKHEKKNFFKGLGESLYANPFLYQSYVNSRRLIYIDQTIGIGEYIKNKSVLCLGCGPSIQQPHLELDLNLPKSLVGIDLSYSFTRNIRKENPGEKFYFLCGDAASIPYPDKEFDVSLIPFALHHISEDPYQFLSEVARVTRERIIIFDHIKSSQPAAKKIQETYWRLIDGGCNYQDADGWSRALKHLKVVKTVRTGLLFHHVYKIVAEVK